MEIKYEYVATPLKKAKFQSTFGLNCYIDTYRNSGVLISIGADQDVAFNKSDLADLIALLQKFHKQMEG